MGNGDQDFVELFKDVKKLGKPFTRPA